MVVDKPGDWTSHDVVAKLRRLLGTRKVGHAGTLDPMATGCLVVGVGRGTRLLGHLVGLDKTYSATIRLGQGTNTDDAEGEVVFSAPPGLVTALSEGALAAAMAELSGAIMQVPSAVSAIRVDGQRAYARVRAGQTVELAARPVKVYRFESLDRRQVELPGGTVVDMEVDVEVSSGTYIRALARDLGQALGVGGHLTALRRLTVGPFSLDQARAFTLIASKPDGGAVTPAEALPAPTLMSLAQAAQLLFAIRPLTAAEATELAHGRFIEANPSLVGSKDQPVAGVGPNGELVALLADIQGQTRPITVFTPVP